MDNKLKLINLSVNKIFLKRFSAKIEQILCNQIFIYILVKMKIQIQCLQKV